MVNTNNRNNYNCYHRHDKQSRLMASRDLQSTALLCVTPTWGPSDSADSGSVHLHWDPD